MIPSCLPMLNYGTELLFFLFRCCVLFRSVTPHQKKFPIKAARILFMLFGRCSDEIPVNFVVEHILPAGLVWFVLLEKDERENVMSVKLSCVENASFYVTLVHYSAYVMQT